MNDSTKYVGLDVSKEKIAVAVAEEGRNQPQYIAMIPYRPEAIRKQMSRLGDPSQLRVCYEAGPTGYGLYRLLKAMDIYCEVIAPSLIPQKPGNRVKTDRRDALQLAKLYRAGELTPIYVPSEDDEALRDLVRAREDVKEDELRAKHRLTKFLLRNEIKEPSGVRKWTRAYKDWLDKLSFEKSASLVVFQEYLHTLKDIELRLNRLEKEIERQAKEGHHASMIQALQVFRGISIITATSLVAEIGSFQRFQTARQFMAYTGLIPSEHSSGESRRQGKITKTGNRHVRRLLIESAWSYRYQPAVKGALKKRQENQPPQLLGIAWKAQTRLHTKYFRLMGRGKEAGKVVTAIARELAGFVWALTQQLDEPKTVTLNEERTA
ncbi:IS110 family transposase [Sporolactobacillus terrae]|uniref:IS110 family transposase n=1 Tax=Sporolactobacillus terrae TaxID=269673 RepID=A0ABX5Q4A6_9BACL|nr:IS110 family transposase [Sporolactobacillus terrae]QAA21476.1 IS110 family transposase [Sporolactobacillus terrae]QAA24448.1 IS110 family transposase [Sporolactobacillus terrae]UAK16275.1 IS110 family transposase [Sporolactobacillus terrae]